MKSRDVRCIEGVGVGWNLVGERGGGVRLEPPFDLRALVPAQGCDLSYRDKGTSLIRNGTPP